QNQGHRQAATPIIADRINRHNHYQRQDYTTDRTRAACFGYVPLRILAPGAPELAARAATAA
ncbi:hypothetical protein ACFPID_05445, partial [Bifidobacterium leontopitheci]